MKKKLQPILRVSSVRQWNKGSSVTDQFTQIKEYAEREGHEVAEPISIQISGKLMTMDKSQLSVALVNCKEKNMELAVSRLDRLSRSQIALLQLKEASEETGVDVHICSLNQTMNSMSHLHWSCLSMLIESERLNIVERVSRSMKAKTWKRSIGHTLDAKELARTSADKRLRLAEQWAESIGLKKQIRNAAQNLKNPTIRNVCKWMNGEGSRTRRGNSWTAGTLHTQMTRLGWKFKELVS